MLQWLREYAFFNSLYWAEEGHGQTSLSMAPVMSHDRIHCTIRNLLSLWTPGPPTPGYLSGPICQATTSGDGNLTVRDSLFGRMSMGENEMLHEKVQLTNKQADGYVIPLGPINLVNVTTDIGMVGCGAFDVAALDKFDYPAARVRPIRGSSIATIDDLLVGAVKDANAAAIKLGGKIGKSGREALDRMVAR